MANHHKKKEKAAGELNSEIKPSARNDAPAPDTDAQGKGKGDIDDQSGTGDENSKESQETAKPSKAGKDSLKEKSPGEEKESAEDDWYDWDDGEPEKKKKTRTPLIHSDEEVRGMLLTIRAETKLTFLAIIKAALRAWHDKLAYMRPMYFRRLSRQSLRIMSGVTANVETAIHEIIITLVRARMNPAKIDGLIEELRDELDKFKELRRTISREAGIPVTSYLTNNFDMDNSDIDFCVEALMRKKMATTSKEIQNSYDKGIQHFERCRPETFDAPENPDDYE